MATFHLWTYSFYYGPIDYSLLQLEVALQILLKQVYCLFLFYFLFGCFSWFDQQLVVTLILLMLWTDLQVEPFVHSIRQTIHSTCAGCHLYFLFFIVLIHINTCNLRALLSSVSYPLGHSSIVIELSFGTFSMLVTSLLLC